MPVVRISGAVARPRARAAAAAAAAGAHHLLIALEVALDLRLAAGGHVHLHRQRGELGAGRQLQHHPSSFIVAFVADVSAFAFAEFVPLSFGPFGLGQFASTSFAKQLDRLGPSSFAAKGSPAFGRVPSTDHPFHPCHPWGLSRPCQAVTAFAFAT